MVIGVNGSRLKDSQCVKERGSKTYVVELTDGEVKDAYLLYRYKKAEADIAKHAMKRVNASGRSDIADDWVYRVGRTGANILLRKLDAVYGGLIEDVVDQILDEAGLDKKTLERVDKE